MAAYKNQAPSREENILIIEDETDIAELLKLHLSDQGYQITVCNDGQCGLDQALSSRWNLIILDLHLPGVDGLEICREVRRQQSYIPILMLTSKSSELDRIVGLELGADDYLTKPFSVLELVARVKAMFRRVKAMHNNVRAESETRTVKLGNIKINSESRETYVGENLIDLTAKEFELLMHFAKHPNKVFRRSELLNKVWGYGHEGYEHTVNSHINRLRAKIEADPSHPKHIVTVWGVGYKFDAPLTVV